MKKKDLIFKITKTDDDNRTIEGVFSTPDIDRSREPGIDQESWDLKNFKKNPVVLFCHDNYNIVIGIVTKIFINDKGNLAGTIKFAVDEGVGVYGDLIKTLYNLYKGKFMRAFSVGFIMGEIIIDKKKKTKMVNNELLEISCVPVPANALALAKSKGLNLKGLENLKEIVKVDVKKYKDLKELILVVDKENKRIIVNDGEKIIGKGIILKQFRNQIFLKKQKTVVPKGSNEKPEERKEKSSSKKGARKTIKNINKIIRTLLLEKQKVKSNTEKL